jgi:hypothetical protein
MRTTLLTMRLVSLFFALIVTAGAAYAATSVYPTGVFPADVLNVQAAVNGGGSVVLKATDHANHPLAFNFGDGNPVTDGNPQTPEHIDLIQNVSISGERSGNHQTTIHGGFIPVRSELVPVKGLIQGIKFERPAAIAISIGRSNGFSIIDNEIDSVLAVRFTCCGGLIFTQSSGIYAVDEGDVPGSSTVVGQLVISRNYIHGLDGEFEIAFQADGVGANMIISDNTLELGEIVGGTDGQFNSEGIAIVTSSGPALISGNKITIGNGVFYGAIDLFGAGSGGALITGNQISIGQGTSDDAIGVYGPNGLVQILGNVITSQSPNVDAIFLAGLSLYGGNIDGALVLGNSVTIHHSSYGGITLYGAVSNSDIDLNYITGDSAYALDAVSSGDPSELCQANKFLGNLITHYAGSVSTIYLDTNTRNNVVRGPYATVIDNGTGNHVSH